MTTSPTMGSHSKQFDSHFNFDNAKHLHATIVEASDLSIKNLYELFSGNIAALRIPNFCPKTALDQAVSKLQKQNVIDYTNAEGVGKYQGLGMAYFEAENPALKKQYFQQAIPSIQAVRNIFDPYLSPIDKVRLILDEQWPQGATPLNLGQGSMFIGLIRAISSEVLPHEDKLERDAPGIFSKADNISQAAFNCYMSIPESSGALQLWDLSLNDDAYHQLRGSHYGIPRDFLPPPKLTMYPHPGELICFNPRYLHAVTESPKGTLRISASGFILYQGKEKPLHFWS